MSGGVRVGDMQNNRYTAILFVLGFVFYSFSEESQKTFSTAEVFSAYEVVRPGERLPLAVRITVEDGWHTYAEEPGDSGMPPSIEVTGPNGIETSTWRFPPSQIFTDSSGTTYGYEHEVVLLGEVMIPDTLAQGVTLQLNASLQWMICRDVCVFLEDATVITVRTGPESSGPSEKWVEFVKHGSGRVVPERSGNED